eukprot:111041_1
MASSKRKIREFESEVIDAKRHKHAHTEYREDHTALLAVESKRALATSDLGAVLQTQTINNIWSFATVTYSWELHIENNPDHETCHEQSSSSQQVQTDAMNTTVALVLKSNKLVVQLKGSFGDITKVFLFVDLEYHPLVSDPMHIRKWKQIICLPTTKPFHSITSMQCFGTHPKLQINCELVSFESKKQWIIELNTHGSNQINQGTPTCHYSMRINDMFLVKVRYDTDALRCMSVLIYRFPYEITAIRVTFQIDMKYIRHGMYTYEHGVDDDMKSNAKTTKKTVTFDVCNERFVCDINLYEKNVKVIICAVKGQIIGMRKRQIWIKHNEFGQYIPNE